jgi:4,5-dihydroxyphthalate decarboxylase
MPPSENTHRLFENPISEGFAYVKKTGVFPINTVLTIREETIQSHPELPAALMVASQQASELYIQSLESAGPEASYMGIPVSDLNHSVGLGTFRPGLELNRSAIEMMLRYCREQGLAPSEFKVDDLFFNTSR